MGVPSKNSLVLDMHMGRCPELNAEKRGKLARSADGSDTYEKQLIRNSFVRVNVGVIFLSICLSSRMQNLLKLIVFRSVSCDIRSSADHREISLN